ncbi:MAG: tripartite tricarboxylate transporter TctB family protein [Rhodobacteraceae bacterium]|nr:tripartite tricarboxylate transporter TctB family protein [Paracoccaceae bacterium]
MKTRNRFFNGDVLSALALLAPGLGLLAYSYAGASGGGINAASTDSPMQLPRLLLGAWILLGLLVLAQALHTPQPRAENVSGSRVWPLIALTTVMAAALPALGYLIPVSMGLGLLLIVLGERRPLRGLLAFAILGPGLWYLFHHALGIRLPAFLSGGLF